MKMEEILRDYYADGGQKLHKLTDKILSKFGGISQKDYDDFYSIANEVMAKIVREYDNSQSFEGYLYPCLSNRIKSEMTARNRMKRKGEGRDIVTISLETPVDDEGELTVGDFLRSDFDVHDEAFHDEEMRSEKVEEYFRSLSPIQKQMVEMRMNDIPVEQIKRELSLGNRQYDNLWNDIKSFSKISVLFNRKEKNDSVVEEEEVKVVSQTLEKSKPGKLSVSSIIKKMDKHTIRFDHPLQRESEQWTPAMKGNLISDILQSNPIPELVFAEQVVNGLAIIWDLDGKQRCTNVYSYIKNTYKISRNIRRWMIVYQAPVVNEKGEQEFDGNNFPVYERREFDIRGKYFRDLPEELQETILDYNFEIVQYLNCSSEDIAYHIARYNEGKPMTASQKGITRIGEEFAAMVKSISRMSFFKDLGGYKVSEVKNGTIERVVIESVMAANYLNDWKKKLDEMCEFVKDNASVEDFDNFEDMVTRLERVVTDDTADMFNSRDSFLWFGLFARFVKTGLDDMRFVDFMSEFARSLHRIRIDGNTYDELNGKSTKDKSVIVRKINHLETLMNQFLGVKPDKKEEDPVEKVNTEDRTEAVMEHHAEIEIKDGILEKYREDFCKSGLMKDVKDEKLGSYLAFKSLMLLNGKEETEIQKFIDDGIVGSDEVEDALLLMDMLDCWTLDIDNSSPLLEAKNIPELLKLVSFIDQSGIDDDKVSAWLGEYSRRFTKRPEKNRDFYEEMAGSLMEFAKKE